MIWSEPRKTPWGLVRSAYPTPEFFEHRKAFEKAGCVLKNGVVHHWAIDGEFQYPVLIVKPLVFVNERHEVIKTEEEPMDGAPQCVEGRIIWMKHDLDLIKGSCKHCGWQCLKPLINTSLPLGKTSGKRRKKKDQLL